MYEVQQLSEQVIYTTDVLHVLRLSAGAFNFKKTISVPVDETPAPTCSTRLVFQSTHIHLTSTPSGTTHSHYRFRGNGVKQEQVTALESKASQ